MWKPVLLVTVLVGLTIFLVLATIPLDGEGLVPLRFEAHSGTIEARNQTSRVSSTGSSGGAKVAIGRIALINTSEHALMRRVVSLLRDKLADTDFFEEIDVVEALDGQAWTLVSDPLPDLCLVLSMPACEISGFLPAGRTIAAQIRLDVGRQPWCSSHRVMDHLSPPLVDFHISSTLEHHSVTRGIETAAARYQLAAENVATALADDVHKGLSQLVSKHGRMGQLGEAFYGQGDVALPELPWTDDPAVHRHYSGPRFMVHNEACWSLRTDSPRDWLQDLAEQLEAGGWRVRRQLDQAHSSPHLRAVQHENEWVVEAFQPRVGIRQPEPREAAPSSRIVLRFQHRFSPADVHAAVESRMTDPLDIARLTMFSRLMSSPQRDRFYAAIERSDTADPALLVDLARHHKDVGDPDRAMQVLRRAVATYWVSDQVSRRDLEKLGREITGDDGWQISEPDQLELRSMGYQRLEPGEPLAFERQLNQPALLYRESGGQRGRHAVVVEPAAIPEGLFTLSLRSPHGASRSTPHHSAGSWQSATSHAFQEGTLTVHAKEQETGAGQFHIRVEFSPHSAKQPAVKQDP